MFLPWKLISKKINSTKNLIVILIAIPIVSVILGILVWDSCAIQHVQILNDIEKLEEDFDPEFCENIVYRIDNFNEECEPEIEILDCG